MLSESRTTWKGQQVCEDADAEIETHFRVSHDNYHPNILQIIQILESKRKVYIALEQCMCELFDVGMLYWCIMIAATASLTPPCSASSPTVLRTAPMKESDCRLIFRQVMAGVLHLHSLGVAHRDISLENILVAKRGDSAVFKISDFGLACAIPANGVIAASLARPGKYQVRYLYCASFFFLLRQYI